MQIAPRPRYNKAMPISDIILQLPSTIARLFGGWFGQEFWLTRMIFVRALGAIYLVAFLGVLFQMKGLVGSRGLLPAQLFLQQVKAASGSGMHTFWKLPTVFWWHLSDHWMTILAITGVGVSAAIMLGLSNGISLLLVWIIYMSFVHIGQVFYGYGWESLLLETGFLAIFLYPMFNLSLFPAHHPPPKLVMALLLWVLFRNMFGAGMIKVRGDDCWRDLTCLNTHFETQPLPNLLSPWFHRLPQWMLKGGVLFNHVVELLAPFGLLLTAPFRIVAGILTAIFQIILIISGNLSWLNWLTLVLCIPCFDDRIWRRMIPQQWLPTIPTDMGFSVLATGTQWGLIGLGVLVAVLSIQPIQNLLSSQQRMNTSYDPFHLVNSYGAFGSVGKERFECVIKGSHDPSSNDWQEYGFPAKPGPVMRRHPIIAPYQPRLDWQIWFAAMGNINHNPWLVHLVAKLLKNDPTIQPLIGHNPFKSKPPTAIKIDLYRYTFAPKGTPAKWQRQFVGPYLPPITINDPALRDYLAAHGWPAL